MKQKLRKSLAWLLTLAMLFTMLPGAALAAEAEHLCDCGTDDESIHATTCAAYIRPENPVCYCAEPCTEANEWCDVCGFDYTACTGKEEATSYFTNPTGKDYIPYTGASQVLINATSADSGYTWGYFAYGSSADPIVNFPNSWETPTAADVDRYIIHCFHVDNAVKNDVGALVSQYNGKPNASLTVYIYPVISTDPVAATGLVADGTAKTLITSEGRVSGGQNGDVLYAVTRSSATKPGSFSTAQPTATEPGTYKVWFKAWAQGPDRDPTPWGVTAPDSAARYITVTITDPNACIHESYENGFCSCGAFEPAELKDGYYQISNGGQLFWFAKQINEVDRTLSAVLIDDIDLENRPWTPIGSTGESSHNFRGHFDGQGHTIEGLYVEGGRAGLGFFGEVRTGTVENFTIYGEVNVTDSHDYVGGVIGSVCGLNSSDHGLKRNGATIRNITSYVDLTAGAHGIGMVGGFIGYANHETLIENCAWYGTFDAGEYRVDSGAGGFIGRIYNTATVTIRNCAAYGTVKTAYKSGTHDNYDTIYIGGFLSYSPANAKTVLENNLWAGQIINNTNLTAANAHLSAYGTMNSAASKTNCYALEGTPYVTTNNENMGGITTVTAAQLHSGEVAYKLGAAWGQDLGTDDYPVLGGKTVYYGYDSCADDAAKVYTNVSERPSHSYTNGFCSACDSYEPAADSDSDGYYEISNAGQLYWFAQQVNGGKTTINGKLMENITINANVLDANGGLNSGSFRVWTPIGNSSNRYAGTFDGNGKAVSGMYYNDTADTKNPAGLFGALNNAAVQNVSVSDSYFYGFQNVSGIAGSMAGSSTITGCTNSATVYGANSCVGGIVGTAAGSSSITNCTNTGRVTGDKNNVGGIVGSISNGCKIANCTNTGSISGTGTSSKNVGGIAGFAGQNSTVINCYNIGAVSGSSSVGGVVGYNMNAVTTNCYYLANKETDSFDGTTYKTTAQFASGEVAYLLGDAFGQTIGTEDHPVLGGAKVYSVTCGGNPIYSNSDESYTEHTNVGGFCAVCGAKLCDHSGNENKYTDCTVDFVCSICGVVITEAAAAHTPGTDDGDCTTAVLCSVCGTAVVAAKKHAFDSDSKCTNDGCTAIGYMLWVGGEQFTSKKLTINGTTGTATYDPENNILTLDNYTYEGEGYTWNEPYGDGSFMKFSAAICYGGTAPIRLVLNGESTVVHTGTSEGVDSCGVYTNGSIEILDGGADGIGSLTAKGGPTKYDYSYGVYASNCSINVTSGSLTGIGGTSKYGNSNGVYAKNGSINVTGGTLTGIGSKAEGISTGVWADEDIVFSGSGEVVATGGDSYGSSRGVATYGSIQVTGGSLNATCGSGFDSGALYAEALTMGTGYGIVTPVGGKFDAEQRKVVDADGNPAKEVKIAEKPVTYYDLWVGGEQVTSEKLTITDENGGTAAYDPEDNILTLDSYTYEGVGYNDAAIYYGGGGTLKLVLVNDNTVTHIDATDLSYGIYADNGSIKISGDGSLTVTADDTPSGQSMSCGIFVSSGDLTILGGTVTATGGKASGGYSADSFGIYVRGMITISGGTVTATGGEVVTDDDTTVGGSSGGICAYGKIHISGGEVNATGGEAYGDSYGVSAYVGLTLGEGIGILTPVGGYFDDGSGRVVDAAGNIAKEVVIAEMPDPVKVQLKLTKEFNDWGKADGFTFNLAAVTENAPMPASPSATATESAPSAYFGEITFTAAGIYEYTITEVNSGIPGVTYDTSAHKVVVTITGNVEDNKLIAEVTYDGKESLIITNTYTKATPYDLWIGGTQVTSHNAADVFGDGKVSYDAKENTLTLNGYTYTGEGYTWDEYSNAYSAAIYYSGTETLNLILKGESTVTHTDNGNLFRSYGLYANDDVVVTEDGDGGSLTITGSVASQESYGVYFQDDFNDNYETVGGSLTLNSGCLTATGDVANGRSCGVRAYGITVTGGSLTVNGGTAYTSSYGAYAFGGSITVTGGTVTATGGDASKFSYGVDIGGYDGNLTVTGGSLTAISGTAGVNSIAVSTHGLTMGEGFGILTPTGGRLVDGVIFDAEGTYATEVEIGAGYTITAAFDSVDEKNVGGTVTGTGFYRAGANVTLTITPDTGCELKSVTAVSNGSTVNGTLSGSTYTFPMPAGNVAVTVTMERLFTPYDLWVGGERFTDKKLTVNGSTGTATYDLETNTLTLDGYTYAGAGHTWEEAGWGDTPIHYGAAIYYSGTETLNLVLNGENTVTHTGSAEMSASYGLYAKGNVVVSEGSAGGSLAVTGDTSGGESYGVYANGSITVSGSLTATGGTAEYESYGVYATGSITVPGSLTATGGTAGRSYGVYATGSITVSGSLAATGGTAGGESYGVYANGSIEVSGSLTATGSAAEFSYGVLAYDGLTMGTGIGILTPEGGYFDDNGWYAVVDADGNPATEVRIAKSAPKVTLTDGNLTVTNTSVEADEMVDMTIMVAGYTGGKMTRCQVIENVTGVTQVDLTVTGDTIKVFFLNPDTYAPLFACAEPKNETVS